MTSSTQRAGFGAPTRPWRAFAFGFLCVALSVGLYFYLQDIENRGVSTEVNWLVATIYNWGGKAAVSGFFAGVGVIAFGFGIYQLLQVSRERETLRVSQPLAPDELTQHLMQTLGFSADDLNTNRQGMLTQQQASTASSTLGKQRTGTLFGYGFSMLVLAGFLIYAAFFLPQNPSFARTMELSPSLQPIIVAVLGGLLLLMLLMLGMSMRRLRPGAQRVQIAQGQVKLDKIRTTVDTRFLMKVLGQSNVAYGTIKVGRTTFYVPESTMQGFKHNTAYRIYYLPNKPMHMLLSAEALTGV